MEFDETVGKVLEFAAADGETLVVITADHETGGLTLARGVDSERTTAPPQTTIAHLAVRAAEGWSASVLARL
eukprot:3192163-Prymnesium_polylepis.2